MDSSDARVKMNVTPSSQSSHQSLPNRLAPAQGFGEGAAPPPTRPHCDAGKSSHRSMRMQRGRDALLKAAAKKASSARREMRFVEVE